MAEKEPRLEVIDKRKPEWEVTLSEFLRDNIEEIQQGIIALALINKDGLEISLSKAEASRLYTNWRNGSMRLGSEKKFSTLIKSQELETETENPTIAFHVHMPTSGAVAAELLPVLRKQLERLVDQKQKIWRLTITLEAELNPQFLDQLKNNLFLALSESPGEIAWVKLALDMSKTHLSWANHVLTARFEYDMRNNQETEVVYNFFKFTADALDWVKKE